MLTLIVMRDKGIVTDEDGVFVIVAISIVFANVDVDLDVFLCKQSPRVYVVSVSLAIP